MITTDIDQLKDAFVEVIGVEPDCDFAALAYGSTVGWDSVAHMALIASIETRFDIMLTTDDVIGLSSFAKAKEIAGKYGVAFDA